MPRVLPASLRNQPAVVRWRVMVILFTCPAVTLSGSVIAPSLATLAARFSDHTPNSDFLVRIMLSVHAFSSVISSLLIGIAMNKWSLSRQKVLIASISVYVAGGTSGALLNSLLTICIGRLVMGIGLAGIIAVDYTLVAEYFEDPTRRELIGFMSVLMSTMGIVFLFVGGALSMISWRAPFYSYSYMLLAIPPAIVVFRPSGSESVIPEDRKKLLGESNPPLAYGAVPGADPERDVSPMDSVASPQSGRVPAPVPGHRTSASACTACLKWLFRESDMARVQDNWRLAKFMGVMYLCSFLLQCTFYQIPTLSSFYVEGIDETGTHTTIKASAAIATAVLASVLPSATFKYLRSIASHETIAFLSFLLMAGGNAIMVEPHVMVYMVGCMVVGLGYGAVWPCFNDWIICRAPNDKRDVLISGGSGMQFLGIFAASFMAQPLINATDSTRGMVSEVVEQPVLVFAGCAGLCATISLYFLMWNLVNRARRLKHVQEQ